MKRFSFVTFAAVILLPMAVVYGNPLFIEAGELLGDGKYTEAVKLYNEFAMQNQDHDLTAAAIFNAASISHIELGDHKAAVTGYAAIINDYPDSKWKAESYLRTGEILLADSKNSAAFDCLRNALETAENCGYATEYWVNIVADKCTGCVESIENEESRAAAYRQLVEMMPAGSAAAQAKYSYAVLLKNTGKEQESVDQFMELMSFYPREEITQTVVRDEKEFISEYHDFSWKVMEDFGLMRDMLMQGQYDEAESILTGIRDDHDNRGWKANAEIGLIVNAVYKTGGFENALDKLQDFLDDYPEFASVQELKNFEERWNEILKLLDRIAEDENDFGAHEQVGFLLMRYRFMTQAERHFQIAAANPDFTNSYLGLGYVYLRTSQLDKAVENFEIYLKDNQDEANTLNQVGYAYLQLNQLDNALKCFEKYKDLEPDNPNSHDSYAECLMNLERFDEAIVEYNIALDLDPNWSNGVYMLGEIFRQTGKTEQAIKYYERYLELDPQGRLSEQAQTALETIKSAENN